MSSAGPTRPLSARVFLHDATGAGTREVLARSISHRGVARSAIQGVRRLPGSALQIVDREIATAAEGLLDLDLGHALVSGWRKHRNLTAAAKRTRATPGSEEVVVLATHQISSTYRPYVELFVDDVGVGKFGFELTVAFEVDGLIAVVKLGNLVALRGGECRITVTLSVEGEQLAHRQGHLDPALLVRLNPPVALLGRSEQGQPIRS